MPGWQSAIFAAFRSPAPYVSWAAATVSLAVSGPFTSADPLPLIESLFLFGTLVAIALVWGIVARVTVQKFWPDLGYWPSSLLVVASGSILLAAPIHALALMLSSRAALETHSTMSVSWIIFALGLAVAAIRWALTPVDRAEVQQDADPPATEAPRPRLLNRLDQTLQGNLIRVSGQNHHVEVVTSRGSARVLLRLSDALAEIDDVEGLQVHRSHWVAVAAIVGSEKSGDKTVLVMSDGSRVPISRSQRNEAERRGLL
mgnify:CR=1 FL=1